MHHSLELDEHMHQLVLKHSDRLIRVAFTYVKNMADAEDIVQETFLSYMKTKVSFASDEHEKAWLIRVTINKCKNIVKAGWFKNRLPLLEDLSYLPDEESGVLQEVLSLAPKYRICIHLFYYEGYSMNEIAEMLKTKPATIGTRLARGRALLKEKLGGYDHD